MTDVTADDPAFTGLAELVIDIAREIQLRATRTTPVVPLTPTQGQIMRYVHGHPGCSASDLADGAGLQRTNVSTALRELRRRGYITSQRDDADGRAIRIEATALADETIRTLTAAWAGSVADAWSGDAVTLATVTSALARVRDRLASDRTAERADRATKAFPAEPPTALASGADSSRTR